MKVNWQKVVIFLGIVYSICLIMQVTITIEKLTGRASDTATVSLEIISAPATPETPGGGGGGGSSSSTKKDFTIDQEMIKVQLKQGEYLSRTINIKNTGEKGLKFKIEPQLNDILSIAETEFILAIGEERQISLDFLTTEDTIPGIYVGKITIKAETLKKTIPVIVEVESKKVLFDVSLDVVADYRKVMPGGRILSQITLFNLENIGRTDVTLTYYIKDEEGNIIYQSQEIIGVETQASFVRTFDIPKNLDEGNYILVVQARYDHSVGTASELFEVSRKETEIPKGLGIKDLIEQHIITIIAVLIIVIIILIMFSIYLLKHYSHRGNKNHKRNKESKKKTNKLSNKKSNKKRRINTSQQSKRISIRY